MTRKELIKLYAERKDTFQRQINTLHNKSVLISWIRVATAVVIVVLLYLSFQLSWLWLITVLTAFVYAYLVSVHERIQYQRNFHKHLLAVNESEIRSLNHDHTGFDAGHEFMDSHHPYALDLDIFGEGSLFQRINRTCTEPGRARLAEIMSQPLTTMSAIKERQELLQELAPKLDFRQHFQATGLMAPEKKEDQEQLMAWLTTPSMVFGKKRYTIMLIIFPLLALGGLMYWLVYGLATPFILIALAQWTIIGSHIKRVSAFQEYIGNKRHLLEKYSGHFRLLMEERFNTQIMMGFREQSKEAYHELRTLASRSRALDLRLNMLASIMLNSVMLYDLFCVYRLEQWKHKNSSHLELWLHAIRETDALNSLSTFVFNHPGYVFPDITDQRNFSATELGHPLLSDEACIGNDVTMDEHTNVWIVTGANMAGKSTFLRTTGVNVVLALTGCVVRAAKMVCPIVEVHTGMRNTDSINDNQSYFFAELLRLQKIMERLREGQPMLILLDEILKGTNSVDKLTGSEELVRQLAGSTSLVMIATHDVALGELERQYTTVKNYHFETMIHQDELSFDYKLKPGVSTGKNATFLMKKMGIIPS